METAPTLNNESERIKALRELNLLDTDAEERYDRLTRLLKQSLGTPIVLISLVDAERQWFKSKIGIDVQQTSRDISFCDHAIESDDLMIVQDARHDNRFKDNPLVVAEPKIRFYAGYPLKTPSGYRVGTLCAIDFEPKSLSAQEQQTFRDIGQLVESELAVDSPRRFMDLVRNSRRATSEPIEAVNTKQPLYMRWFTSKVTAVTLSMMVFFLCFMLSVVWQENQQQVETQRIHREAVELASNIRGKLETELNSRLHLTKGLAGLVVANERIDEEAFQQFATELGRNLSSVSSLQLAPDGVVKHVWPYEQHKKAIGHDLLADPKRKVEAQKAIEERAVWLAGPLNLIQGGVGLIGRYPVFLENDSGEEVFWGFSTILLDFERFIAETGIATSNGKFEIAVRGIDSEGEFKPAFYGDSVVFNSLLTSAEITLPAGQWQVGVRLTEPLVASQVWKMALILISLLTAIGIFGLLRLPARFNRAVEQTSQALEQSEVRFRDAIEALPDGFVIFDKQDRLLACNSKYRDIYDKTGNIIAPGRTFYDMTRDGYQSGQFKNSEGDDEASFVARRLKEHRNSQLASEIQLADGRWIRQTERPIRGGGTVGLRVDITESKIKERELATAKEVAEQASHSKSQFLATVSHEVRTPMNVILGLLDILKSSENLSSKEKDYAITAHQSADHLLHLLNEILDISKVEAGKLSLDKTEFNILEVIRNVCSLSQTKAEDKGISLKVELDDFEFPMVEGDERRLQQILLNLLSNAIKFTDQGWVKVTAKQSRVSDEQCNITVEVEDTGIGFSANEAKMLFKPFSQIDSSAARKHEGTGLGLAITRELTQLMGGQITAEGFKNQGAAFTLKVPFKFLPEAISKKKKTTRKDAQSRQGKPLKILIAEDSPANQIVFSAMLNNTRHQIDMVENGQLAVSAFQNQTYDLVLMDIYMPEMNGIDATKAIRRLKQGAAVPIVALTANAMKGDREKFIEAGMDDYLPKPIDKDKLIGCINRWSDRKSEKKLGKKPTRMNEL